MTYQELYEKWVNSDKLSDAEHQELVNLKDIKEIEYRFGKDLEFGTAGMRGIIGLGTNMINVYTVRRATQGLAEYILALNEKDGVSKKKGVVISYDTRRQSKEFAQEAALVLASNGIRTYLFDDVRPVPMLSFAVRQLKTVAGIMITASHNPKEYNGYKVYGEDGAQMSPAATSEVVKYIEQIDDCLSDKILCDRHVVTEIYKVKPSIDKKYYKTLKKLALSPKYVKALGKTIKIVYTPVHGSGYIPVTTILKKIGINPILVQEQLRYDPEFSTVELPNPEYKETLNYGIKMADIQKADVVFGTDPDCDRLGVAIRNDEGKFEVLSGNQVGILLTDYVLRRLKATGKLTDKGFIVKSFVTTSMAKLIAESYKAKIFETPVGFKFIGEKIKEFDDTGKMEFLFGFEESCGYLRGTHCRDKDAVVASMLFAEMVCYYDACEKSVYQRLQELYKRYGYIYDTNFSITYSGLNAMKDMISVVDKLKTVNLTKIAGVDVVAVRDYSSLKRTLSTGEIEAIDSAPTNAIYYELKDGGFICVRPSGTEPKLKVYFSVSGEDYESAVALYGKMKQEFESVLK